MKPVIGINCDLDTTGGARKVRNPYLFVYTAYFDAVAQAGGLPLLIPFLSHQHDLEQTLNHVDGLLLTGGADLDPSCYGEAAHSETKAGPVRRMAFDLMLARTALAGELPILGVCLGMQLLNLAAGGSIRQHIETDVPGFLAHQQMDRAGEAVHTVTIRSESRLARVVGPEDLEVNSTHHQALAEVAPGFEVCARAADGIVEAIEREAPGRVLGVQWHPERLLEHPRHRRLFEALVHAAVRRNGRREGS